LSLLDRDTQLSTSAEEFWDFLSTSSSKKDTKIVKTKMQTPVREKSTQE